MRIAHHLSLPAAVLIASALPMAALAADATIRWELPTKQVDGSDIPKTGPDALKSTRVKWSFCKPDNTSGTKLGELEFPMPATSAVLPALEAGRTYCIQALVVNNAGESSRWSNTVAREIPVAPVAPVKPGQPQPPTLSTTVNVAFKVIDGAIQIAGTVPIGTQCEARSMQIAGAKLHILPAGSGTRFDGAPIKGRVWSVC